MQTDTSLPRRVESAVECCSELISLLRRPPLGRRGVGLAEEADERGRREDDGRNLGWTCAAAVEGTGTVAVETGYSVAGVRMGSRLSWGSLHTSVRNLAY